MTDASFDRMMQAARTGRLSRRDVLERGLKLGMSTAAITALMAAAPEVGAAPRPLSLRDLARSQGTSTGTFTMLRAEGAPDLDPHYQYNNANAAILLATTEMLIQYKGESTFDYEPMLAESWEANADNSTYTFKIFPNVTFHDGDPCTSAEVKASFDRLLIMNSAVANVVNRFVPDPAMLEIVDDLTVRFNLGKPQPLFLAALASSYGPFIINPKYVEEHKTDDDPWAHEYYLQGSVGTGPYKLVENNVNERVTMQKYDGYHGGWEGAHFDELIVRVVPEIATRRQLIESGDADATVQNLTPEDYDSLKSNPDVQVVPAPSTAVWWTMMNVPRLKTPGVRQGFSYAFPYKEVQEGVYKGLIKRTGPIASTVRGYDPDVFLYQTDLTKAKELILAGGFAEGDTFEYIFSAGEATERAIAELFQANVAADGLHARHLRDRRNVLSGSGLRQIRRLRSIRTSWAAGAGGRTTTTPGTSWCPTLPRRRSPAAAAMPGTTSTTGSRRSSSKRRTTPTKTSTTRS